jgi:hypothetical protein
MAIPASDPAKKIPQADLQPFANLLDVDQGEIPDTTFNAGVIRAVKPASFRSFFLAKSVAVRARDGWRDQSGCGCRVAWTAIVAGCIPYDHSR